MLKTTGAREMETGVVVLDFEGSRRLAYRERPDRAGVEDEFDDIMITVTGIL